MTLKSRRIDRYLYRPYRAPWEESLTEKIRNSVQVDFGVARTSRWRVYSSHDLLGKYDNRFLCGVIKTQLLPA